MMMAKKKKQKKRIQKWNKNKSKYLVSELSERAIQHTIEINKSLADWEREIN